MRDNAIFRNTPRSAFYQEDRYTSVKFSQPLILRFALFFPWCRIADGARLQAPGVTSKSGRNWDKRRLPSGRPIAAEGISGRYLSAVGVRALFPETPDFDFTSMILYYATASRGNMSTDPKLGDLPRGPPVKIVRKTDRAQII